MSFLTWYAPNHLRQENRNWSIGCGLLRQWAYQNFLIVSKHIATGSARFWTLWMYPGQTASSKAATTKRKSWNVYASACVISIISEDVSCFATHKSSAESTPGTAWDDFLFLYPNYWRRTLKRAIWLHLKSDSSFLVNNEILLPNRCRKGHHGSKSPVFTGFFQAMKLFPLERQTLISRDNMHW